jgi:2-succinyl-5-enolpyruvyl-6-hydroxy-3-cyclohexene-1-carboxylate synthase
VIRIGDMPTSKPLRAWVADAQQVVIDPDLSWSEPTRRAGTIVPLEPAEACRALTEAVGPRDPEEAWIDSWLTADLVAKEELAAAADPFEPRAYTALAESLDDGATVWLSSSMPVRDVETFFPSIATEVRFLSNRGANGIDGTVSSALGAALASGGPCVLLTGELALLHDLGGLVARGRLGIDLTIVCVNNGGGGIFDFLPVAGSADAGPYEDLIATPHEVSLETVAALAGMEYRSATTQEEIRAAAVGPTLVEVRTDRSANVAEHRALFDRIAARI